MLIDNKKDRYEDGVVTVWDFISRYAALVEIDIKDLINSTMVEEPEVMYVKIKKP